MISLVKEFDSTEPDIIFLITPHGFSLSKSHGIYLNQTGYFICIYYKCQIAIEKLILYYIC